MFGPRARPVLSGIADRFRSIHMVLFDRKRNSRGRLSAALRKTNPSQTISNGSMSARMRHTMCVHPRSIRFSRCTPARLIRSDRAARQGDILPDRRAPAGGNLVAHNSYTVWDSQLYLAVRERGPRFRDPLFRLSIEIGFQSPRPAACDLTLQSRQVLHQPRRHPRP